MAIAVHDAKSIEGTWTELAELGERITEAVAEIRKKRLGSIKIDNEAYRARSITSLRKWVRALEISVEEERSAGKVVARSLDGRA